MSGRLNLFICLWKKLERELTVSSRRRRAD
jgi:hypothetical protein